MSENTNMGGSNTYHRQRNCLECLALANERVRREAPQRLQSAPKIVGCYEIIEMRSKVLLRFVEITTDRRLLDGSVHALDLTVGPWMPWFRQPVIDVAEHTGVFEGMGAEQLSSTHEFLDLRRAPCLAARIGEMGSIIGQDGVDLVGDRRRQTAQEIGCDAPAGARMELDEGELRGAVNRYKKVELSFFVANLSDVYMKIADRIGLELSRRGLLAVRVRQSTDTVPLQEAMQRRARQVWDCRLQRIEAIVEGQERMPPEGDDDRFLRRRKDRRLALPGPCREIGDR